MTSDWQRVQSALGGNREALELLVREHLRPTYAVACGLTGSVAESEDVVQEVFARALGGLEGFRRDGRFGAWLVGIARRVVAGRRRESARRERALAAWVKERRRMDTSPETAAAVLERKEALELLEQAVARLPEDLRIPLLLYYVEDISQAKVAERLDLEPATVRKRLQRARGALGAELTAAFGAAVAFLGPSSRTEAAVNACVRAAALSVGPDVPRAAAARTTPRAALVVVLTAAGVAGALWLGLSSWRGEAPAGPGGPVVHPEVAAPGNGAAPAPPEGPADVSPAIPVDHRVDVRGRVVDEVTSEPIARARVSLVDAFAGSGAVVGQTLTNDSGRFRFEEPVPPRVVRVHLRADKEGYASRTWTYFNPRVRGPEATGCVIPMQPGVAVEGLVLVEDGDPVSGGTVFCYHHIEESSDGYGGGFQRNAPLAINARGRFRVWMAGERAAVLVTAPGHVPAFSAPFAPARLDGPVVVHLERGRALEGQVVDPQGQPVRGASVLADCAPRGEERGFPTTVEAGRVRTDDDGRFRLDGLAGFVGLQVAHSDFEDATFEVTPFEDDVTLEVVPARWLRFVPVLPGGEEAVATTAELYSPGSQELSSPLATFFRSGGVLRSEAVPGGVTRALLVVPRFLPVEVEWPAGAGPHDLGRVELERGVSLDLKVVDASGRAIPDARVRLPADPRGSAWGFRTDESGQHCFDGLAPGEHELVVDREGFLPLEEKLVVRAPQTLHTVELDRGATLVARIVDSAGAPISGATLRAFDARIAEDVRRGVARFASDPCSTARSDADGRVQLSGIPPGSALWLVAWAQAHVTVALETDPIERGQELDAGNIVLGLGATFRVRVRDESGAVVPWARVYVDEDVRSRWWASVGQYTQTGLSGSVEVTGLPAGVYSVKASGVNRAQRTSITVETDGSGIHDVEIVLADAVTYAGTVVYEDRGPVEDATIWLDYPDLPRTDDYRADISSQGRFKLTELPCGGPIGVHVLYGRMHEQLEAPSAEELPERIVVPRGASLALEVAVADGGEAPVHLLGKLAYEGRESPVDVWLRREIGFLATDLPAGRATISVQARDAFEVSSKPQVVELAHGTVTSLAVSVMRDPPGRLVIVATGPGGGPIPEARILLYDAGSNDEVARTGPDGTATVEWTGELRGPLLIEAPGWALARVPRPVEAAEEGAIHVSLVPESVVLVDVRDEKGEPVDVGHASITLKEHIGRGGAIYRSAPIREGAVRLDALPAGTYRLRFGPNDVSWGTMEVVLGTGEVHELAFRVPPPLELHGRVLHNGRPVAGRYLYFRGQAESPQFQIDGTGSYRARLFARGKYTVWVFSEDQHGEFDQMIDVEITRSGKLDIELRTAIFKGWVLERETGDPVGKVDVKLSGGEVFKAPTSDDGAFFMPHVEPGKYRWRVFRWVGKEVDDLGRGEVVIEQDTTMNLEVDAR